LWLLLKTHYVEKICFQLGVLFLTGFGSQSFQQLCQASQCHHFIRQELRFMSLFMETFQGNNQILSACVITTTTMANLRFCTYEVISLYFISSQPPTELSMKYVGVKMVFVFFLLLVCCHRKTVKSRALLGEMWRETTKKERTKTDWQTEASSVLHIHRQNRYGAKSEINIQHGNTNRPFLVKLWQ